MTTFDLQRLRAIIDRAWDENYPPELEAWDVKGRKAWRKARLLELIAATFGEGEAG